MKWLDNLLAGLGVGTRPPLVAATEAADLPPQPVEAHHHPSWSGVRMVQGTNRSRGLTPERLARLLRAASNGDVVGQAELFDEMEDRDGHLVSVLGTRKRAVAGLPFTVEPASDRARDRRIAQAAQAMIEDIDNWQDALVGILDAIAKGYSGTEIDWRQKGDRVWVQRLLPRPAAWFVPDRDQADLWRIRTEQAPAWGEPLQPGAWIWHEAKAKSGATAAGAALMRPLAWIYLFRNYTLKDWLIFAETYGAPVRIGKYRPGTGDDDLAVLYQALKDLGVDAAAMIPDSTTIEFVQAASTRSSVDVYAKLVDWGANEMSKAVLGQTLTTQASDKGTQALGRVHDEVRQDLIEADAAQLSRTLTRDLVVPWVAYQFGPQDRYPRLVLQATPDEDLDQAAGLYVKLAELGVQFPADHVHSRFGIPRPPGGPDVYGKAQAAVSVPADAGAGKAAVAASEGCGCSQGRLLTLSELDDLPPLARQQEELIRSALQRGGYAGWEQVIEQVRAHLMKAQTVGQLSGMLVDVIGRLELQPLQRELADELLTGELIGRLQVAQGERPVETFPRIPPREAIGFWTEKVGVSPEQFAALDEAALSRAFSIAGFTSLRAVEDVQGIIGQVLAEGGTLADFEDRWEASAGAGWAAKRPHQLDNIYRTNIGTAVQVGRYRQQRRPSSMRRRPYLLYDAIDDGRGRASHVAMDGRAWPADHPIWDVWYPLNGFGCRCGVRSRTAGELAEAGIRVETELPQRVVVRPDGAQALEPLVPDDGFRRNPALSPPQFDWSRFPSAWTRALGVGTPADS